jgi:hypothetical protein
MSETYNGKLFTYSFDSFYKIFTLTPLRSNRFVWNIRQLWVNLMRYKKEILLPLLIALWSWALLEKPTVVLLLKDFTTFTEPESVHKSSPLAPVLNQINPVHTPYSVSLEQNYTPTYVLVSLLFQQYSICVHFLPMHIIIIIIAIIIIVLTL